MNTDALARFSKAMEIMHQKENGEGQDQENGDFTVGLKMNSYGGAIDLVTSLMKASQVLLQESLQCDREQQNFYNEHAATLLGLALHILPNHTGEMLDESFDFYLKMGRGDN